MSTLYLGLYNFIMFCTLCRKKINIAGLKLLSSEGPPCKVGPWLVSGNLAFELVLQFSDKGCSQFLDRLYKQVYIQHLLPSRSKEFWQLLDREYLCDQLPVKILGVESLKGFSGQRYHTQLLHFHCWRKDHTWCHERERAGKPKHGFLQILPVSFLLADSVMHPFTLINFSSESFHFNKLQQ